jgi:hypothetical protein
MKILRPLLIFGALTLPFAGNSQSKFPSERTINYELERNEPTKSGLFGLVVNPVYVDGYKLNISVGGGLGFFYTMDSRLRISGGFQYAYLDNITNGGHSGGEWESYGLAVNSKNASSVNIMANSTILSWEKERNYHIVLGSAGYRTVAVTRVRGNVMRALTTRVGYQVDNRLIQSKNGNLFKTNTPEFVYHYEGNTYSLTPTNLGASSTMMKSNIVVVGIGYTTFRDIKITVDGERYNGRREEKSQNDLFFDVLFAHKLNLQDMIYYHSLNNVTDESKHLPQRFDLSATALNKTGFRIGYQAINMYQSHFGTKILLEGGLRPGPKNEQKDTNLYGQLTIGIIFGGRISYE